MQCLDFSFVFSAAVINKGQQSYTLKERNMASQVHESVKVGYSARLLHILLYTIAGHKDMEPYHANYRKTLKFI